MTKQSNPIKLNNHFNLPISVEEQYQYNNQLFKISDIRENYYNIRKDYITEEIQNEEGEVNTIKYELFYFQAENKMFCKNEYKEKDQIRVKFYETNDLHTIKIRLNNKDYDLRNLNNEKEFIDGSIPTNLFVILEYVKEVILIEETIIVDKDDGMGGTIPVEETITKEEISFFFQVKYIENFNCNLVENNYNTYYNFILSSFRDVEKTFSRQIIKERYKFSIDEIKEKEILMPLNDIISIDKITYYALQEIILPPTDEEPLPDEEEKLPQDEDIIEEEINEDYIDTYHIFDEDIPEKEKEYIVVEKELDPNLFKVMIVGDYNEKRVLIVDNSFETPKDIINSFYAEAEMPYNIYFNVGFETIGNDLVLAFKNDIQYKMTNRGSDEFVSANKSLKYTDIAKNIFNNYKRYKI